MSDDEFLQETLAHLDLVYNLARRATGSRQDAEDLVQETFLRALHGWRRNRPKRVAPWLATICLNTARSQHRRGLVRPTELLGTDIDQPTTDAAEQAMGRIDAEAIHGALAELPEHQREAIVLMDLCGFTAAQVGRMLRVPRNTVLSRVHRGHKRLAELLEETRHES